MRAGGFYLMHRGWMDSDMFPSPRREPFCHRAAWAWLVEHAAHQQTDVGFRGRSVNLERGQLMTSHNILGVAWGWNTIKVLRVMRAWQRAFAIVAVSVAGGSLITVCNYSVYQDQAKSTVGVSVRDRRSDRSATVAGNKEGKELEEKREAKASPKKGTRWAGVVCQEWIAEADAIRFNAHLPAIDAGIEADKFADHWIGKSGQAGVKLDWHATWRNWVRNAKGGGAQINGKRSAVEKLYAGAAAAAEEWERREADSGAGLAPVVPLLDRGRPRGIA